MIVRISGTGQFEIDDECVRNLDKLDTELTNALHNHDEKHFHEYLAQIVQLVRESGKPLGDDIVLPSEVIVPPEDISMDEGHRFLTDEGLMAPIPA